MRRRFPLVAGGDVIRDRQPGFRAVDMGAAGVAAVLFLDLAHGLRPMVEMAVVGTRGGGGFGQDAGQGFAGGLGGTGG